MLEAGFDAEPASQTQNGENHSFRVTSRFDLK